MRCIYGLVWLLLIFSLTAGTVTAISITPGQVQRATYSQGKELNYEFRVSGAQFIHVYIHGSYPNITEQATLYDPDPYGGPRTVRVKFVLDQPLPPGNHKILVSAKEISENVGAVGATAEISAPIIILSLYPGKYLVWKPYGRNLNVNESINLSVDVQSLGTERINAIYGKFDVYDQQGNYVDTITTNSIFLESDTKDTANGEFDATGLLKGYYYFNATLYWDKNVSGPKQGSFRVGTRDVILRDYTKTFIHEAVNLFELSVASDWNDNIREIYAEIETPNAKLKTPTESIERFKAVRLQTYWDTSGLDFGEYDARIDLYFEGQRKTENVVLIINETGAGVEPPKKETLFSNISTTTLVLIILIIILAINFIYFFLRGLKKK